MTPRNRGGRPPKLSLLDVAWLRAERWAGATLDELAIRHKLSRSTVRRYLRGETVSHRKQVSA